MIARLTGLIAWVLLEMILAAAEPVAALQFSPDGKYLLVSQSRALEVRPVTGKAKTRMLPAAFDKITAFTFSPDGRTLAVAGGTPGESGGVQLTIDNELINVSTQQLPLNAIARNADGTIVPSQRALWFAWFGNHPDCVISSP